MAFCTLCGKEIPEGSAFCPSCGAPTEVSQINLEQTPAQNFIPEQPIENAGDTPIQNFATEQGVPVQDFTEAQASNVNNAPSQEPYPAPAQPIYEPISPVQPKGKNIMALISMILGIISICIAWVCLIPMFGIAFCFIVGITSIAGIVLFTLSRKKGKDKKATIGLILSIVAMAVLLIGIIINIVTIGIVADNAEGVITDYELNHDNIEDQLNEKFGGTVDFDSDYDQPDDDATEATLYQGDTYKGEDFKITVLSTSLEVTDYGEYLAPEDGRKYVAVELEFENVSGEDQYVSSFNADAYVDDAAVDQVWYIGNPDYKDLSATLAAGKKTSGYLVFSVPAKATEVEVIYNIDLFEDKTVTVIIK